MKKLLLGSIVLLSFNLAVILTQMSCRKESMAQTGSGSDGLHQQNSLLVFLSYSNNNIKQEIRLLDYSGKLKSVIPLTGLPSGFEYVNSKLSPDGKSLFVSMRVKGEYNTVKLYSMQLDGSNVKEIYSNQSSDGKSYLNLEGAY